MTMWLKDVNQFCILSSSDHYQHPALFLVDGVSSICALDFRMDEWGIDVALTGSQKALSLPTGMGIVCASPKALEASKTAKSVRVFFDWNDYLKFYKLGTYWPYTPSIQLLYGLRAALDLIFEEGLDNVIARHGRLAKATRYLSIPSHVYVFHYLLIFMFEWIILVFLYWKWRLAVEAWGLKNCTQKEEWFSDTVTAVVVPSNIDSSEIVRRAWKRYNLSLGLGLNKVAGKVFRIGHLGNLNEVSLNLNRWIQENLECIWWLIDESLLYYAVATIGVSCWSGDGAERRWVSGEPGEWGGGCFSVLTELDSNDPFQDLMICISVVMVMIL